VRTVMRGGQATASTKTAKTLRYRSSMHSFSASLRRHFDRFYRVCECACPPSFHARQSRRTGRRGLGGSQPVVAVSDIGCGDCDSNFKPVALLRDRVTPLREKPYAQKVARGHTKTRPRVGTQKARGRSNLGTRVTFRGA
jgi:hypothetical protein